MKRITLIPGLLMFAMAGFASATTYNVRLVEKTSVHGTELKPGEYKLDVDNGKAVFRRGRVTVEAAAKVTSGDQKFKDTKFLYNNGANGQLTLREIDLGGSNVRVTIED